MDSIYYILRAIFTIILNLFFKDISIIGLENLPKKGPVIICGNHANQFLDALLMFSAVSRKIGFIVAAKSYRRFFIGDISRLIGAIPVERSQDIAKMGPGHIVKVDEEKIYGVNTKFTEQVKPGDFFKIKEIPVDIVIKQVNSDTELVYTAEIDISVSNKQLAYKIFPKVDQTGMYDAVWQRLTNGGCVGMFPEGGSHDRTQMLPLKAGVCLMALGAMTKYKHCEPIKIVPCGFNYFKGYKFRSKAVVEFGVPYEVPQKLINKYSTNKREAISNLLQEIEKRMKTVTLSAPSYSELSSIYLARKLYTPAHSRLSHEEEHLLNRILALGYNELKDEAKVKKTFERVRLYNQDLRRLKLDDSAVKRISSKDWKNFRNLIYSFVMLLISGSFALPGLALNGPIALFIKHLSEKERQKALAISSVKIKGNDVIGSYKVLCAIIAFPVACVIWTFTFAFFLYAFLGIDGLLLRVLTLAFFLIWPFYSCAMIYSSDGAVRHYRNLKARFALIFFKSKIQQLRETRRNLQKQVTDFVENNAQSVIKKVSEDISEDGYSSSDSRDTLHAKRENSLRADEALDQAFEILEEIGI